MISSKSLSVLFLLVCSSAVFASPGPEQIHKCTTITKPGSYAVTDNITAAGDCIVVAADHVSIDLGGFLISGNSTGAGILINPGQRDVTIHDGAIWRFARGIDAGGSQATSPATNVVVERVRVTDSNYYALLLSPDAVVRNCVLNGNWAGVFVGARSSVSGTTSNNNTRTGIEANCPSNLQGNTASNNPEGNIVTYGAGCNVEHNTAITAP